MMVFALTNSWLVRLAPRDLFRRAANSKRASSRKFHDTRPRSRDFGATCRTMRRVSGNSVSASKLPAANSAQNVNVPPLPLQMRGLRRRKFLLNSPTSSSRASFPPRPTIQPWLRWNRRASRRRGSSPAERRAATTRATTWAAPPTTGPRAERRTRGARWRL